MSIFTGPTGINVKAIVKAARDNPDLVRGIKAHAEPGGYSRWGMAALKLAKEASREVQLPVYIHLGTLWPELHGAKVDPAKIIDEVVPLLDPGDILAHPFTRFPSGFVAADGTIHPLIREALAKGVRIDVGRGAHFSFTTAQRVIDAGILPFTIGADLHGYNVKIADGGRAYRGMFTGEGVEFDRRRRPRLAVFPALQPAARDERIAGPGRAARRDDPHGDAECRDHAGAGGGDGGAVDRDAGRSVGDAADRGRMGSG